jgi:hypothetical protein
MLNQCCNLIEISFEIIEFSSGSMIFSKMCRMV